MNRINFVFFKFHVPNYKIEVEYFGPNFCGFQRQKSDKNIENYFLENVLGNIKNNLGIFWLHEKFPKINPSVQSILELGIFCVTGENVNITAAGRTDSGVHAKKQFCNFYLNKNSVRIEEITRGVNFYIKNFGVVVKSAKIVEMNFNARFSAKFREYEYLILNRKSSTTIYSKHMYHVPTKLDFELMKFSAEKMIGTYDFNAFRSSECQSKNSIKTISNFKLELIDELIISKIIAKSFLHNQVRIMIGALIAIGKGKAKPEDLDYSLKNGIKNNKFPTAPPFGLYLTDVIY